MNHDFIWHNRPGYFDNNGFPRYCHNAKIIPDYPFTPEMRAVEMEFNRIFGRKQVETPQDRLDHDGFDAAYYAEGRILARQESWGVYD